MSQVTVTKCDKCKRVHKPGAPEFAIVELSSAVDVESDQAPSQKLELCPKCWPKLLKWFGIGE